MRPLWKQEDEKDALDLQRLIDYNKGEKVSLPPNVKKPTTLVERQEDHNKIDRKFEYPPSFKINDSGDLLKLKIYDIETQRKYKALTNIIDQRNKSANVLKEKELEDLHYRYEKSKVQKQRENLVKSKIKANLLDLKRQKKVDD